GVCNILKSLKHVGILDYFDIVVGADDVNNPKPHQDHVLAALQKLGVEPENAYMVGDTDHDILAGKSAGVKTIGVTYGWLGQDIKKYKPDYVIDDIEQLLKILK
ncbi:HAD-IA family hydrolase, partial [Patescibacteria group bacterium]|nr:HAD-IA family hydrolase [Patescibacteria group bacterium]